MVRPTRFERVTAWFVARYSIQLSYGRFKRGGIIRLRRLPVKAKFLFLFIPERGYFPAVQLHITAVIRLHRALPQGKNADTRLKRKPDL